MAQHPDVGGNFNFFLAEFLEMCFDCPPVQAVFFGALAITTMRMKYLWTPYICVLAAVGVADKTLWSSVFSLFRISNKYLVSMSLLFFFFF